MSKLKALDSFALIAYFENEPGGEGVKELLKSANESGVPLLLTRVNWGEVLYIRWRSGGEEEARKLIGDLDVLPIEIVEIDKDLTLLAASFKAKNKMSLADAFAAALAKSRKAELVTGDPEFGLLAGEINIYWIKKNH